MIDECPHDLKTLTSRVSPGYMRAQRERMKESLSMAVVPSRLILMRVLSAISCC